MSRLREVVEVVIPDKYIYLRSCLKVVWKLSVPEYILTLKIDSTASVLPQYERCTLIP